MKLAALVVLPLLFASTWAAEPAASTLPAGAIDPKPAAERHFKDYLSKCTANEIRCVQFLDKNVRTGLVMTLDLQAGTTYTVRDVHDWALQSAKTHKLTSTQMTSLRELIKNMPASEDKIDFAGGIHVASWENGAVVTRVYSPEAVPQEVRRVYDIGGVYLDAKGAK